MNDVKINTNQTIIVVVFIVATLIYLLVTQAQRVWKIKVATQTYIELQENLETSRRAEHIDSITHHLEEMIQSID